MPALASWRINTKSMPTFRSSSISTSTSPPGRPKALVIPRSANIFATTAAVVAIATLILDAEAKQRADESGRLLPVQRVADVVDQVQLAAWKLARQHHLFGRREHGVL